MKKFLLLVLCFGISNIFSQGIVNLTQLEIPELVASTNPLFYTFHTFDADAEDDSFYIYFNKQSKNNYTGVLFIDYKKAPYQGVLYKVSKNLNSYSLANINIPDYNSFIYCTDNKNSIMVFYQNYDKESNILTIKKVTLDKKNINAEPLIEDVLNFHLENKDYTSFICAGSADKQLFAISMLLTDKKSQLKDLFTATFDNEGEVIWQTTSTPHLENEFFNIADMQVSNDGVVYYCISSYSKEGPKLFNYKFHLYTVEENLTDIQYEDIDFGTIKDMKMKILKNGKLFIGGYYSEKPDDNAGGSFSYTLNPVSMEIENKNHQIFSSDYFQPYNMYNPIKLNFVNQQHRVNCDYIFELYNGKIIMLGEQRADYATYSNGSYTFTCYAKSIITNTFTPEGDYDSYFMIKKNQAALSNMQYSSPEDLFLSYAAFDNGKNVFLIYNDHTNNLSPTTLNKDMFKIGNPFYKINKNSCVTLTQIDENDNIAKWNIMDCTTTKKVYNQIMFINGNEIVFDAFSRKLNTLSKFTLPN